MPEGHRPVEWRSCVSMDPWLYRLGGVVEQNRDSVCVGPQLGRP
jgi:hypothetical protein